MQFSLFTGCDCRSSSRSAQTHVHLQEMEKKQLWCSEDKLQGRRPVVEQLKKMAEFALSYCKTILSTSFLITFTQECT